jgi:aquaporin Z
MSETSWATEYVPEYVERVAASLSEQVSVVEDVDSGKGGGMLMSGVYAGAHVSGANFNPAVSFSLLLTKHMSFAKTITYTAVQGLAGLAAAFAAVLVLETEKIGHPAVGEDFNIVDAFIVEAVFTFALCFVVLNVACAEPNHGNQYYGLAIGFTVTAAAEAIGSISGCALNPAVAVLAIIAAPKRIVETAIVHIGAPMAGGFAAAMAYRVTNPEEFS